MSRFEISQGSALYGHYVYEDGRLIATVKDRSIAERIVAALQHPGPGGEVARLREALIKYGAHTGMCGYQGTPYPSGYRCVCGLYDLISLEEHMAALAQAPKAPEHPHGRDGEEA